MCHAGSRLILEKVNVCFFFFDKKKVNVCLSTVCMNCINMFWLND